MNEKEISEIRRRFRADRSNISYIRGCYVNEKREMIAQFNQSLALLGQDESEKFLAILKKTLSGTLGKNLVDITFTTHQVVDSPEHRRLMALRDSSLRDPDAVEELFQQIITSLTMEGSYLILLACDAYDVPYRSKDDDLQADASAEVYNYFLCSICPVKLTKPALSYQVYENEFRNLKTDWIVEPPEAGFLFPAFDDRSTNLYSALYYTKNTAENHEELIKALFQTPAPLPAAVQKETFQQILGDTLSSDCRYDVVQSVRGELCAMIQEHKENKIPEPLKVSKGTVQRLLSDCGVEEAHVDAFGRQYDEAFGEGTDLSPRNIVDPKQMEIRTPDVLIKVNPERVDLVETRVINGAKYILIRADEGVEVNGVEIRIS